MITKRRAIFYIILAILIIALILLFVITYRVKLGKVTTPFFMAVIIAYLINPMVNRLQKKKISRSLSILLIYLGFLVFFTGIAVFIVPELINNTKELMITLPDITSRYQNIFNNLVSTIRSSNWSVDIKNVLFREIENGTVMTRNLISDTLKRSLAALIETVTMLFDLTLAMVIAYYFIKDADFFKNSVLSLTPRRWRNGLVGTGREIHAVLSGFIQGQMLTAVIVGVLETGALMLVGIKYPVFLGLIGGIANIIPYFGPIIGAVPAVAVALIESPAKAAGAVIAFVIVQQLDNSYISPKIIEGKLGLHPVTTILAVLIGGEFFGIIGMLVSVPIAAMLKVILKRAVEAIV